MTGHYGHYVTYTGPGHALILSGSYPYVNGIAANKFYNAESQRSEAMVLRRQLADDRAEDRSGHGRVAAQLHRLHGRRRAEHGDRRTVPHNHDRDQRQGSDPARRASGQSLLE